ncbi:hypothetical protein D3C80_558930 [compost metagenome]
MQGVDALQQLGLEGLVGVAVMSFHLAAGRVQYQGVEGTWVVGVVQQVEQVGRLAAYRWQAQVVHGQARAGSVLEVGPDRVVVDHQRRGVLVDFLRPVAATAFAAFLLLAGGRRVGQQLVQAFAVPLIGPEQAGEGEQKIEQQAPGTGHGVQVPVEGAAFLGPVEGQPGAPVQRLARPAQVQAGQAEEHQHQGAGAGDLPAGVAHGQEAVQVEHEVEEALPGHFSLEFAGVRVGIAQLATALAWWGGEEDACGVAFAYIDPQHRHLVVLLGLDPLDQFGRGQHALRAHLDLQDIGIQRAQQFFLKRVQGPGDTHQGQHQASGDAKEPVQLEQRLLHHMITLCFCRTLRGVHYALIRKSPAHGNERGRVG